ncbi:uncharacterized protein LOC141627744 [Silene latifolia]|uniref:uncharacterized protein LOC141627744 n=1 Tax=Silene latifolia TaxID=37657 RepID=UPI003D775F36
MFLQRLSKYSDINRETKKGRDENRVQWKAPIEGWWKINVDTAVVGDMGSGMGIVIRDCRGKVERAGAHQVQENWSPEITEAKAAEFGMRTAWQMGIDHIIRESDCMALITMLKSKSFPYNYFGLSDKVVSELVGMFDNCQFIFTHRDGKFVAHSLAHLTPYSIRFWIGSIPESILPLLLLEASGLND